MNGLRRGASVSTVNSLWRLLSPTERGAFGAGIEASMKAQRRYGLSLSWPRVTAALVVDVTLLILARSWPEIWGSNNLVWRVGVGVAVVVGLLAILTHRGVNLPGALASWVLDRFADPEAKLTLGCTPPVDHHRRFSRDVVGLREYRSRLVSVIAVEGRADTPSGRHHHRDAASPLPVEVIAAALRQFDVRLDSIDVVSVGVRRETAAGSNESASAAGPDTGDLRKTWLVLRMDPQRNVAAVATRDSLASTLAAVTERLAEALGERNCVTRPLTADELAEVDNAVLAGLQSGLSRPGWGHLRHIDRYATSFWVSPHDINSEMLAQLWTPDADATVLTIRLSPRAGGAEVSAWVRYHSDGRLPKNVWAGLNRLTGRQLAAVRASLPVPAARPPLVVPARVLGDHENLALPVVPAEQSTTQS